MKSFENAFLIVVGVLGIVCFIAFPEICVPILLVCLLTFGFGLCGISVIWRIQHGFWVYPQEFLWVVAQDKATLQRVKQRKKARKI
jgi:hypothetical protein